VVVRVGYGRGPDVAGRLEANNIICNYQAAPDEEGFTASGALRLGVSEMTRFSMGPADFVAVAELMAAVVNDDARVSDAVAAKRAVELLDVVGIPQPDQRARQYPHEFSGGMRQRVMIAMAISNDPDVLIADEPTTALDVTVQAQILDVLDRIRRDFNTAVVMITHDLGVIARIADRVQVMYAGRVVERTTVHELFQHPTHPYTQGLLHSIPRHGLSRLVPIAGSPPNMLRPPSGCAFRTRCPYAIDACAGELPELRPVGNAQSACIRADELVLEATA
jgi:peptide/nickel transport system ATP-binding protein